MSHLFGLTRVGGPYLLVPPQGLETSSLQDSRKDRGFSWFSLQTAFIWASTNIGHCRTGDLSSFPENL